MNTEYFTDPKFKNLEIIKMLLFFPIFGIIIYFLSKNGIGNITLYSILIIPIGIIGIWTIYKNSKNRPSIIINENGITINHPIELGEIEWSEIKNVRLEVIIKRKVICLDLKNSSKHKDRLQMFNRKKAESSEQKLKTHVVIMEKYVSYKTDEILSIIENKINKLQHGL